MGIRSQGIGERRALFHEARNFQDNFFKILFAGLDGQARQALNHRNPRLEHNRKLPEKNGQIFFGNPALQSYSFKKRFPAALFFQRRYKNIIFL